MPRSSTPSPRPLSLRKRLLFLAIILGVLAATVEVGTRAFWRLGYGVSFKAPDFYDIYYPETRAAETMRIARDDEQIDVLLLGGSVLHERFGSIAEARRERITHETGRPVRVYNAANIAHTTRDSLVKYRRLEGKAFDLVIVYHGINEARANNCPPELFRDDYSHYAWYAMVNRFAVEGPHRYSAAWATARLAWARAMLKWRADRFVPLHAPHERWLDFGGDIKTAATFDRNLRDIAVLAEQRGDPLMLMTFATHVPADYSHEAFKARRLDYVLHLSAIELWGRPDQVAAAIAAHNDAVRTVAAEHGLPLVDQQSLMPADGRLFNDICHFTHKGSQTFVDNLLPQAQAMLATD